MFEMRNAEALRKFLHEKARRGQWEGVVEKYGKYPEAQKLRLTRQGDTALHLAVIDNKEETVETLVKLICRSEHNYRQLLETTNDRQNNPLHLAAVMGSVRMCHALASAHDGLVDMRNIASETPMFLAAAFGNTNVFYCLYSFCRNDRSRILTNCRASEGDTVLHCAIRNENFALAFQLIHLNHEAINLVDERGMNVLHVLASKPTCFKSGVNISGWRNILYNCIPVHQLKPESIESLTEAWKKCLSKPWETPFSFPHNYKTCILLFTMLSDALLRAVKRIFKKKKKKSVVSKEDRDLEPNQSAGEPLMTEFPINYSTCINFFNIVFSAIMCILECGFPRVKKIRKKKQKHIWSVQVLEMCLEVALYGHQLDDGQQPFLQDEGTTQVDGEEYRDVNERRYPEIDTHKSIYMPEEALHLAAMNGVIEIMMAIYKCVPRVMWHTRESDGKNVVHLAAEHGQSEVYKFLLKNKYHLESLFRAVDKKGNSALHLAASRSAPRFWHINGEALQMQWEVEWYKLVKQSMPRHFFARYNHDGKTASTIFEESHMDLVQKGKDWLYSTSQSCTLVATLIATVAFATAAIVPGSSGNDKEKVSFIFAISSLVALSLSTTSVIMFLAILTSRSDIDDYFGSMFPWKLLIGLSSLYTSIIAMLISFCTGSSYFIINHHLPNKAILLYTLIFLPVPFILAIVHLPLSYDLLLVLLKIMPKR